VRRPGFDYQFISRLSKDVISISFYIVHAQKNKRILQLRSCGRKRSW